MKKILNPQWFYDELINYRIGVLNSLSDQSVINDVVKDIELLNNLHPFLVGSATLESLVNETPSTYEYISCGKLPFDNLFFEFKEPIKDGSSFFGC